MDVKKGPHRAFLSSCAGAQLPLYHEVSCPLRVSIAA